MRLRSARGHHASVPADARVMVHQIWLGDRREDPTRLPITRLKISCLSSAISAGLRSTPPKWAQLPICSISPCASLHGRPMHALTRAELKRTRLTTVDDPEMPTSGAVAASSPPPPPQPSPRVTKTECAPRQSASSDGLSSTARVLRHSPDATHSRSKARRSASSDLVVACVPAATATT